MGQRFLIYAINGNGFGHVVRTLSIATRLRRRMPDATFLFLTSCEDPGPIWREGFASVKVPSIQAKTLAGFEREEFLGIVRKSTDSVFRNFRPTALIADTVPQGNVQELTAHLAMPIRKILLLRPSPFLNSWSKFVGIVGRYDHVLIPYDREDGVTYPGDLAERGQWIGRIMLRSLNSMLNRDAARGRLGLPAQGRTVLISFGGGGNEQIQQRMPIVLQAAAAHPEILFALLRPPLGRYRLPALETDNVRWISYFPIMECLRAFDAAVCTSGTNTAAELAYAGLPMVWMPLDRVSIDQGPNAALYARRGIGLLPRKLDAAHLTAGIRAVLDPQRAAAMRKRMAALRRPNGADVAVKLIAGWCAEPTSAVSPARSDDTEATPPAQAI